VRRKGSADEVGGFGGLAYVRGRFSLAWTQEEPGGKLATFSNAGNFLSLLRRQADGSWRISRQIWDDPPPRQE
jgi:ketosteroid isomerase-like protein